MRRFDRLLPYLRRYRGRYVLGLTLVTLAAGAAAVVPLVVKAAVEEARRALEPGAAGLSTRAIVLAALALVLFAGVRSALVCWGRYTIIGLSRDLELEMRRDLYRHLLSLPARWFDTHPTGDITSRFINDLEGVRLMVGFATQAIASTGLTFLMCVAGMAMVDWRLALYCLVPLSLISLVTFLTGSRLHVLSLKVQDQLGVVSTRAQENFTGARVIKAFAQEEAENRRFEATCGTYRSANLSLARLRGAMFALLTLFIELTIAVTIYFGGLGIMGGRFTEGDFIAFIAWQFMLVWPMVAIGWVISVFQRGVACMGRLNEILEATPAAPGEQAVELAGGVEVRDLTFRYAADRPPALNGVSFSIRPGERVGLVGATPSGKSTIAALLLKLYEPPRGTILIDGRDINDLSTESLRRAIGAVTSEPHIFSDSMRENIAFGSLDAATDEDVARAARLARIAADAERFPDGMKQLVGERGVTLSGGQKQRTALARALLRRPRLLILDDALSSVDAHTEREILDELREFMKGRTCIVISHRMSAVRDCDRIVVLEEGRVAENGSHAELIARRGLYARMCERQQILEQLGEDEIVPPRAAPGPEEPPARVNE
jgi:ATP-binding cassette subfamily B protein